MAIYRSVYTTFWTDAKVVDNFTPEDRYFYLYLMTNPHTNLAGCYEISFKQISDETGYTKEVVERLLDRMEVIHNVIRYSRITKELLIINWNKFNWTRSGDFQKCLKKEIEKVKDQEFKDFLYKTLDGLETVLRRSTHPVGTTVTVTDKYNKELLETKVIDSDTKSLTETEGINSIAKDIQEIIDYLNLKTGKHYTTKNKANVRKIQARFKEGYKVEDFKKIIDTKYDSWKGTKYQMFLRPETLFSAEHFESYLNESIESETPKYESKPKDEVYRMTEEEIAEAQAWWDSLEDDNDV